MRLPVVLLLLAACLFADTDPGRRTIRVKTADELIDAICSNVTIELAPGRYNLSTVAQRKHQHVVWEKEYDGLQIMIHDVSNLTLRGPRSASAEIVVESKHVWVLRFKDAKNIALSYLVLGHTVKGECGWGVLEFRQAEKVTIDHCDLYGCGFEGIGLDTVKDVKFQHSIIRDCTCGSITLKKSKDISFADNEFKNNGPCQGMVITSCSRVRFDRCLVCGNEASDGDEPLFDVRESSEITVKDCKIRDNTAARFCSSESDVESESNEFAGNSWQ